MTRWHKHLKFPIKICRFSGILFNNYAELYAKITVYEGIQCKVTKLRSIQINFNPLMSDGNKRSYMLLKQTCSFKYVLPFLPPDIKWLTGLHKCLKFAVHTCIDFKELRHMHVLRHFVFERVSSLQISIFSLGKGLFLQYNVFTFGINETYLKRYFLQMHCILKKFPVKFYL